MLRVFFLVSLTPPKSKIIGGDCAKHFVQISIDDFGTGYSSLSYLHRLPVNTLKIDRSFVSQMQPASNNTKIVETLVALSDRLGLHTIAEGIETQQQLKWLQQLGCELAQGYLFSKPLTPEAAEILIETGNFSRNYKKRDMP